MLTILGVMVQNYVNQVLSIYASLQLQLIYNSYVLLYVVLVETLSWGQQGHTVQKYSISFCPPLVFQSLHTAQPFELVSSFSQQSGSFYSSFLDFRMMAIHISLSQPAFALVTFCTSGASVVSCSVLFGGNYKLKNFSPWLRAVTRKHILPPLTCFLLEVIAGCVIISPLHSTYTVVQSHMTGVSLHLDLCCVSLCVVRWHLWYKMC